MTPVLRLSCGGRRAALLMKGCAGLFDSCDGHVSFQHQFQCTWMNIFFHFDVYASLGLQSQVGRGCSKQRYYYGNLRLVGMLSVVSISWTKFSIAIMSPIPLFSSPLMTIPTNSLLPLRHHASNPQEMQILQNRW